MHTFDIFEVFRRDEVLGFNLIFQSCRDPLAKYAFKLTRRTDVAEDVASDALALFWKKRHRFESYLHIKRFLYQEVKKRCEREQRKLRKWYIQLPDRWETRDPDAAESAVLDELDAYNQWFAEKIRKELKNLPDQRAQDFLAFTFGLKSYKEIALERDVAESTVRMNVALVIKEIRKYLKDNKYSG